jgi:hypothetical protein
MLRSGFLIAACLATGLSASAQQSGKPRLAPEYHGVWAVGGTCEQTTFIFAATFIERAGEDICYIDKVEPNGQDVSVTATCWHEGHSVGRSKYTLVRKSDDTMIFADRPDLRISRCGPVPQDAIDFYTRADQ